MEPSRKVYVESHAEENEKPAGATPESAVRRRGVVFAEPIQEIIAGRDADLEHSGQGTGVNGWYVSGGKVVRFLDIVAATSHKVRCNQEGNGDGDCEPTKAAGPDRLLLPDAV